MGFCVGVAPCGPISRRVLGLHGFFHPVEDPLDGRRLTRRNRFLAGGGRFRALRVGETRDAEGGHHARDSRNADQCSPPRRDRYNLTHGATPSRKSGTRMTRTRRVA
jgi:hypothetical protein